MLSFIDKNPTAYHTCESVRNVLTEEGFEELLESDKWNIIPGGNFFRFT